MTQRLKVAVLGCGDVAQRDYLPEMHRLQDRVEMVAVCGRSEARARTVAEQYGIDAWFTDYRQMLTQGEAEAVINLTPIQLHAETTLACLQAGKHVYSEKPAATTVADAMRLREVASDRGLVLVCAPSILLYPQVREAQNLLERRAVGPVHSAVGQAFGGVPPWSGYASDPSQFFAKGAGPVADMGVYPLHVVTGLFGPAQRVNAMAAQAQREFVVADGPAQGKRVPIEVADTWHLLLEFENDLLISILANNSAAGSRGPQLELYGLEGTIALNLLDVSAPVDLLKDGEWQSLDVPHERSRGPDHLLGVEHLVECVQRGEALILSVDHAVHVLEIIEAADRSAMSGQRVDLMTSM
jgi:predicted dehydrogenase